jgi:hypothetical protein
VLVAARVGSLTVGALGDRLHLGVLVVDANGRPLQAHVTMALVAGASTFASTSGLTSGTGSLGLTTGNVPRPGCYTARVLAVTAAGYAWDGVTPAISYCVLPAATVASVALTPLHGLLHATASLVGTGRRPLQAGALLAILRGGSRFAATAGHSGPTGLVSMTAGATPAPGCYTAVVQSLSAPGYTWNRLSPHATYCVPPSPHVVLVTLTRQHRLLHLVLRVVGTDGRPLQATVSAEIRRDGTVFASTAATTGADGSLGLTASAKPSPGCYTARIASITAPGYTWAGGAPNAGLCIG